MREVLFFGEVEERAFDGDVEPRFLTCLLAALGLEETPTSDALTGSSKPTPTPSGPPRPRNTTSRSLLSDVHKALDSLGLQG